MGNWNQRDDHLILDVYQIIFLVIMVIFYTETVRQGCRLRKRSSFQKICRTLNQN